MISQDIEVHWGASDAQDAQALFNPSFFCHHLDRGTMWSVLIEAMLKCKRTALGLCGQCA